MLNGSGFIPGDTTTHHIFKKQDIIQRHGAAMEYDGGGASLGYEFLEEDSEEYNLYVVELYERVHQRLLLQRLLPLHFARGLAVERAGEPVDWLEFAMACCFLAWKRTPFVPLDKFANNSIPYPFIHRSVLPQPDSGGNVRGPRPQARPVSAPALFRLVMYSMHARCSSEFCDLVARSLLIKPAELVEVEIVVNDCMYKIL